MYPNVLLGFQAGSRIAQSSLFAEAADRTREELQIFYAFATAPQSDAYQRLPGGDRERVAHRLRTGPARGRADADRARLARALTVGVFSPAMDAATHHFHSWVANRARGELLTT